MIRRSTPTKDAVLNVLADSKKAMSQDAIMKKVSVNIDRATVYRVLNRFCEDGILHRIVAEDGKQYFAVCIKCEEKKLADHHFHFRCTKCETIECLPVAVQFSLEKGYSVESVNCILTGVCKDCA
ncbi:transcriptional regulator [Chryseobacterium formosense]|uniref:Transcriptional regulator n=1 Tax=Chryseobacterium formosense TaxID=236814 RepID=A0A085Z7L1_9FLAO|nr:transcriptional repressor [Chryseobacterium formosense]KFF00425.1 transcriptional regulator [Chryseobacterium formosense]SFT33785.1 Fur family transcriptional regulator, ferric uptake regulator [Chryseobacterium formosense]